MRKHEGKTKEQLLNELEEMRQRIKELEASETERKRIAHDLAERVKELGCLYGIAGIAERPHVTLAELYQEVASLLPDAWQYPEMTCARVIINNKRFETENWRETVWKQSSDVKVYGVKAGTVEVCYLEERPPIAESPFFEEERQLIDAVAERLGRITERRQTEEALRQSEERFRALTESTSDWVWEVDADGVYTYISPKVKDLLGYEPEEVIGKTPFDLMPPEEAERITVEFRAIVESQRPFARLENTNLHKDGRLVVLETSGVPFFGTDGRLCGYRGIDRDITERKKLEERIRQQNEFLTRVLESLSHPFYVMDVSDYTVKIANSAAAFGPTSRKTTCYALTHNRSTPCSGTEHACPLEELKKTKKPVTTEHLHYDSHGNATNVEVHAYPIFDEKGNVSEMIAYVLDITERRRAEEARVEKTAAQARAEEVEQSRQRIIVMQESLRKDIAQQIHGTVQNRLIILTHRLADLEKSSLSEQTAAEVADLRQKLEELLDGYIRPISHRLFPSILRRGLVPALQSLVDQFETVQSIDMKLSEELKRQERINPRLITERVRLAVYRIAEEALVNATKHAKASGITVELETSSEGWLRLTVRDDGRGFDVESASASLGILMMQDYAEVMGGSCVISSTPGRGTEVTATIPLAEPEAEYPETA